MMTPDMVVTADTGMYVPGRGGAGIEDSGVVRLDGYEPATSTTKDLLVL